MCSKMIRPAILLLLSLLSIALCAITVAATDIPKDPLTVQIIPATMTKHTYNPAHPPPQMPTPQQGEAGVTVSEYSCVAEVSGQITSITKNKSDVTVAVQVDSIHMTLKLNITEWMSQVASQKIWFHEDGHRMIALHFYNHADDIALAIAHGWIGQSLSASGPDAVSAAKQAVTQIAQKITAAYMTQVRDQSELVQEDYDRITAHGTNNIDEADAIEQALKETAEANNQASANPATQPSAH